MNEQSPSPWYAAGLAFECQQCGRCCAGPEEGYVWVTPDDIAAIAAHLGIPPQQVRDSYLRTVRGRYSLRERPGNRDCLFLVSEGGKGGRCAIYPVRPMQCHTWPFWAYNLASPDAWSQAGRRCGGINRGPLQDREQIEARRDATKV